MESAPFLEGVLRDAMAEYARRWHSHVARAGAVVRRIRHPGELHASSEKVYGFAESRGELCATLGKHMTFAETKKGIRHHRWEAKHGC